VVVRQRLAREIHTSGQFVADESRLAHVHVKVSGYIEKVFADFPGQSVRKGQPLFTVYSPDLVATQQEYLIAKRGERSMGSAEFPSVSQGAQSLLASARERLKLWDISDAQIEKLDRTGEVSRTMTIYSPVSGVIQERKAFPNTAVNPDTDLYTVADLSRLWVNADIYEYEAPYVRVGQPAEVRLSYFPGKVWRGRINFIYPQMDAQTRTLKVRIDLPNPGLQLKPQMFADVTVKVDYGDSVVVPEEAVLDSGREQTVFVAQGEGRFVPRKVTAGAHVDGKVVILSGLKAGDTVVTSGNFLVDSESQLRSATEAMQH
jgi:membrane fusion protein, copper/silver efflux system